MAVFFKNLPKFDNDEKPDKKQASETEKPFARSVRA